MSDSIRDKKGLADAKPSASRDQALDSMKEFSEKKFTVEYIAR
jgi:hypothetical protein